MSAGRDRPLRTEQNDVKRKAQVTQQDHAEFSKDFQKKRLRDPQRDPIEREFIDPRADIGGVVVDAETNELIGTRLGNGGHYDCITIPTKIEHMKQTRSWTLWYQWQPRLNHLHRHPEGEKRGRFATAANSCSARGRINYSLSIRWPTRGAG